MLALQTTEYYRTVRDSEGNEETTVTKQIGDQRYSVTTHTDSKGEKQQTESFENIEKGKNYNKANGNDLKFFVARYLL